MTSRLEKFSEGSRRVLSLAQEEAQRLNHNYVGTEHILLGLVRETDGVAAKALYSLGVELTRVRSAVEIIIGRGERLAFGDLGLTPRAKKVIKLAVDEARRSKHDAIGTEHLLIGLVREGDGVAAMVLSDLGVTPAAIRSAVESGMTGTLPADASQDRSPKDDEAAFVSQFKLEAAAFWGAERARTIDTTLSRAAHAVWLMGRLDFTPSDFPAHYLDGPQEPPSEHGREPRSGAAS